MLEISDESRRSPGIGIHEVQIPAVIVKRVRP